MCTVIRFSETRLQRSIRGRKENTVLANITGGGGGLLSVSFVNIAGNGSVNSLIFFWKIVVIFGGTRKKIL